MWPAEGRDRKRREREASLSRDRDRKRKREEPSKEEKRDKQDKHSDKHVEKSKEKHSEKHGGDKEKNSDRHGDRHGKRDGNHERRGGDDRKRGDDGNAYGDRRREGDKVIDVDRLPAGRSDRKGDARSDKARHGDRDAESKKPAEKIPTIEAAKEEEDKDAAGKEKKDWREEMDPEGEDDERDLSDDEAATERKLAESRKRREAMMAKFVTEESKEKETEAEEPDVAPKTPKDDADDSGSDAGAAERPEKEGASKEQKEEVTKFILAQKKAEDKEPQGDMFGDLNAASAAQLNSGHRQSDAIGLTGASGDDWDDGEGYYCAKIGEAMDDRYLVVENFSGKGVFSNVVKAKDKKDKDTLVAIKVMRCNDMMKKAAEKEIEILQILNNSDKANKRHIVRLITTFYYRKHLCLVFECMWDDLRKALKKYTKGKGMSLQAVRAYTKQLIIGLRHMHKCNIIHADIKPDNILISEGHNIVKFCDLGTALEVKDAAVTPYLVSRFYRAPEIILGCEYGVPVDVFALGATLCELFTGKILFNSKSNNDALFKIMEVKGKIPKNVIKRGLLWKDHFDENLDFKYADVDKYTKNVMTRVITDLRAKKDIFEMFVDRVGREKLTSADKDDSQTIKRIKQFAELINLMVWIDPEKRITANDALSHPFLEDRLGKGVEDKNAARR